MHIISKETKGLNLMKLWSKHFHLRQTADKPGADPDKNMTFSKPIMTDMPRPFPGNDQEVDFSALGV